MIRLVVSEPGRSHPAPSPRRRFGLDTPLPADPHVVERAILRHLATRHPDAVVLGLARGDDAAQPRSGRVSLSAGAPGLMILLPGGLVAFLLVKTQARRLTAAEQAFRDLCRTLDIPVEVVRSLPEARRAFERLNLSPGSDR